MKNKKLLVLSAIAMLALTSCGGDNTTAEDPTTDDNTTVSDQTTVEDPTTEADPTTDDETTDDSSSDGESTTEDETTDDSSSDGESSSSDVTSVEDPAEALSNRIGELESLYSATVYAKEGAVELTVSNSNNNYLIVNDFGGWAKIGENYYAISADEGSWDFTYDFGISYTAAEFASRTLENLNEENFTFDAEANKFVTNAASEIKIIEDSLMLEYIELEVGYAYEFEDEFSGVADQYLVDASTAGQLTFTAQSVTAATEEGGEDTIADLFSITVVADEFAGQDAVDDWLATEPTQVGAPYSFADAAALATSENFISHGFYYTTGGQTTTTYYTVNSRLTDYGTFNFGYDGYVNVPAGKNVAEGFYNFSSTDKELVVLGEGEEAAEGQEALEFVAADTYQNYLWNPTNAATFFNYEMSYETFEARDGAYVISEKLALQSGVYLVTYIAACYLVGLNVAGGAIYTHVDEIDVIPAVDGDGNRYVELDIYLGRLGDYAPIVVVLDSFGQAQDPANVTAFLNSLTDAQPEPEEPGSSVEDPTEPGE